MTPALALLGALGNRRLGLSVLGYLQWMVGFLVAESETAAGFGWGDFFEA